jgi:hypothetical protein
MAPAQLTTEELLAELISQLEIPCEQDKEVAEVALPPSKPTRRVRLTQILRKMKSRF